MSAFELHDAATLARDLTLEADVAIVGTGAGGGVCAEILSAAGLRVVLLEQGALRTARDFSLYERDSYAELYFEGGKRKTQDGGIAILQGRTVGGSTAVNWTATFRTPPQTLAHWAEAHGVRGLGVADLAPWFQRMEAQLNVQPWGQPPNRNNALLARGAAALGWRHGVIPRNVRGCADLGYCGFGCPLDAKQSMLVTTIPAALARGAALVTRVLVDTLEQRGGRVVAVGGQALDAQGVGPTGRRVRVQAPLAIVAGGGINSPALLLRAGVPDPHGLLGRRTFLHPTTAAVALLPEAVNAYQGAPQSVYCDQFLWRDGVTGRAGFKLEVPPLHPVLAFSGFYRFGPQMEHFARSFANLHAIIGLLRDGFHAESPGGQVSVDKGGRARLDYPLTDYVWEGYRATLLAMAECQFAAGAQAVQVAHMDAPAYRSWAVARAGIGELPLRAPNAGIFSAHVMGGCPMGEDPARAVVDSNGRHHQIQNLYVIDGSVFPTSLGVNPQLTIYGIAARNASLLAARLTGQSALPGAPRGENGAATATAAATDHGRHA